MDMILPSQSRMLHYIASQTPWFIAMPAKAYQAFSNFLNSMTPIHFVISGVFATSVASIMVVSDVWRLTAFLAIGASIGILWACLSKESKEEGRITKARILAGIITGICGPRLVEKLSPWTINLEAFDPLIIIAIGFAAAIAGFYTAHSALRIISEGREKKIGGMLARTVERKIKASLNDASEEEKDNERSNTERLSNGDARNSDSSG